MQEEHLTEGHLFVVWKEEYSVNHLTFDNQHKAILDEINRLFNRLRAGTLDDTLRKTITALADYTDTHLVEEEAFLEQHGYPDCDAHGELHDVMRNTVARLRRISSRRQPDIGRDMLNFLKDWWLTHICGADQEYARYFAPATQNSAP